MSKEAGCAGPDRAENSVAKPIRAHNAALQPFDKDARLGDGGTKTRTAAPSAATFGGGRRTSPTAVATTVAARDPPEAARVRRVRRLKDRQTAPSRLMP